MFFVLNDDKCIKCAQCAQVCPGYLVKMDNEKGPSLPVAHEKFCIQCGHCAAVCPTGAVNLEFMPNLNTSDYTALNYDSAMSLVRNRRSIRRYEKTLPDQEVIKRLLALANYAPTAHNNQQVSWRLFTDPNSMAGLTVDWISSLKQTDPELFFYLGGASILAMWRKGVDSIMRSAPYLLVACNHDDNDMGRIDAAIAASYVDLLAPTMGLGCCWAGYFMFALNSGYPPILQALQLEKGQKAYVGLMLGIPATRYHAWPERKLADLEIL